MNNDEFNQAFACLIWKIPKYSEYGGDLLSYGYIREELKNIYQ